MTRPLRTVAALLFVTISSLALSVSAQELRRAGYLGMQVSPAPITGPARPKGVVIDGFTEGGPAGDAGLQVEDLITHVDGREIQDREDFVRRVRAMRAGDVVKLEGRRGMGPFSVTVPVKARRGEAADGMQVFYESVMVDGHRRRTLVAVPGEGKGKRPAVLFATGVGCFSQEIVRPAEGPASLLQGLTREGFITMRVEKSGMGDSEGPDCSGPDVDMDAEVRGYVAGLRALKKDPRVDPDNIFLVGLSIGAVEAPLIVAQEPVKGVVVINTEAKPFYEYLLETRRRQQQLRKMPFDEMDAMLALGAACSYRLLIEKRSSEQIVKDAPECAPHVRFPASDRYMQQWAALNPGKAWKAVESPVLIVVGTSDYIAGVFDSPYLAEMINSYEPGRATLTLIPGMDHHLSKAASMEESVSRAGPGEFEPAVLGVVAAWLRERAR
jgi:pimeloyl-ACP methyl ester carboxylesterase